MDAWQVVRPLAAVLACVLGCGARTALELGTSPPAAALADAAVPEPAGDASTSCTPQPGTRIIATLPGNVVALDLLLVGGSLYIGGAVQAATDALLDGSVSEVSVSPGGGVVRRLVTPGYVFGSLASDGVRLYYPQVSSITNGYAASGLASQQLMTGTTDVVTQSELPLFFGYDPSEIWAMIVTATPARPGLFWLGAGLYTEPEALLVWDAPSKTIATLAIGQNLTGLALDSPSAYWADAESLVTSVYSAPLAGGPASLLATVAHPAEPWSGGTPPGGLLGVSRNDVLFGGDFSTGVIEAVSKTGGPVRQLLTTGFAHTWVDSDDLYWTEGGDPGALKRMPITGGQPEVVLSQAMPVLSVAFGACDLYIGLGTSGQVVARAK